MVLNAHESSYCRGAVPRCIANPRAALQGALLPASAIAPGATKRQEAQDISQLERLGNVAFIFISNCQRNSEGERDLELVRCISYVMGALGGWEVSLCKSIIDERRSCLSKHDRIEP